MLLAYSITVSLRNETLNHLRGQPVLVTLVLSNQDRGMDDLPKKLPFLHFQDIEAKRNLLLAQAFPFRIVADDTAEFFQLFLDLATVADGNYLHVI